MKGFNKMRTEIKVLLLLIFSVLLFTSLYCYYSDFDKAFNNSSNFLKLFFSFITLIIALKIYDKFGINKKITEKRVELLIELLIELKKVYFKINIKTSNSEMNQPFFPSKSIKDYLKGFDTEELSRNILFYYAGERDDFVKNIILLKNNPIMPLSIVDKLDFLEYRGGSSPQKQIELYTAKVYFTQNGAKNLDEKGKWIVDYKNDCTVEEFILKFESLFIEIENWINEYSNLKDELNI